MWAKAAGIGLGFGLACAGCTSDEDDQRSAPYIYCDHLCGAVLACGSGDAGCHSRCVEGSAGFVDVAPAAARLVGSCIRRLDCSRLFDSANWPETFSDCWSEATTRIEPVPFVVDFCEDYSLRWFECGDSFPVDSCAHIYSMWTESVVRELETCEAEPVCDELQSCAQGVFASR